MPDSLSFWFGVIRCTWQISDVKIFKRLLLPGFHSISTKFYCKYVWHEGIQAVTVYGDLPKLKKKYGTLKFLVTQNHMGLEISKRYSSVSFHPIRAKLYDKYESHSG